MKGFLFLFFLNLIFFIIHCGPASDEELLYTDVFSGDTSSQLSNQNSGEITTASEIATTAIGEAEENAQSAMVEDGEPMKDFTLELSVTDDSEESETGPQVTGGEGFEADTFQVQQFYSCTKEGEKTYLFEIYEEPEESPYVCYLLHRYKNCGRSWDPEKEYCYENAVKTKEFCRAKLEKYLTKRKEDGYECVEQVKEENQEEHPEDSASEEDNPQPTTSDEDAGAEGVE